MYDDPVEHARRLLTFHKDKPWATKELADLVPALLKEIEETHELYDDMREKYYGDDDRQTVWDSEGAL